MATCLTLFETVVTLKGEKLDQLKRLFKEYDYWKKKIDQSWTNIIKIQMLMVSVDRSGSKYFEKKFFEKSKNLDLATVKANNMGELPSEYDNLVYLWNEIYPEIKASKAALEELAGFNFGPLTLMGLLFWMREQSSSTWTQLLRALDDLKAIQLSASDKTNTPRLLAILEELEGVGIPNFDWAVNNYHPSHFSIKIYKKKFRTAKRQSIDFYKECYEEACKIAEATAE